MISLCCDIGIPTTRGIVKTGEFAAEIPQVGGDNGILVGGAGEVVAEAAATCEIVLWVVGYNFGGYVPGCSY